MKILHVVTLHSADNAFGGPVRVALNLAKELRAQGNSVVLLAGSRGLPLVDNIEGISCQLFPVHNIHSNLGFSGLFSGNLWIWAWRNVKNFDLVHLHFTRDLVTLPVGLISMIRGIPFIIQTHGMIDPTNKLLGRLLDGLATRRLLLRASRILYLTPTEESNIKKVSRNRHARMSFLPNGVPKNNLERVKKPKIVSFISRMHVQKHPELFVEMAGMLAEGDLSFEFRIAGADEGELSRTLTTIENRRLGERIEYLGALDHVAVLKLLSETKVLVLPSVNETFPMIVLEALSMGVPVVITETCGLAPYILNSGAGVVTDGNPRQLANAVRAISADFEDYSNKAKEISRRDFSMTMVVQKLDNVYRTALENKMQRK